MWSQKDSVSSNRTPRIFNVDDTEIVFPAFDTVDGSYVDRRRCLVLKKIISDLSGLSNRPLCQNQDCSDSTQLTKRLMLSSTDDFKAVNNWVSSAYAW